MNYGIPVGVTLSQHLEHVLQFERHKLKRALERNDTPQAEYLTGRIIGFEVALRVERRTENAINGIPHGFNFRSSPV